MPCSRKEPIGLHLVERTANEGENKVVTTLCKCQHSILVTTEGVSQRKIGRFTLVTLSSEYVRLAQSKTATGLPVGCPLVVPSMVLNDLERTAQVSNGNGEHTIDLLKRRSTVIVPAIKCTNDLIGFRSSAVVIQCTSHEGDYQMVRISCVKCQLGIFVAPVALLREKNAGIGRSVFLTLGVVTLNEVVRAVQSHAFAGGCCAVLRMPSTVLGNLEFAIEVSNFERKNAFYVNELPCVIVVTPAIGCTGKIVVGCVDCHCGHQRHCKSK